MTKQVFKITGMHCSSCAMNIEWTLDDLGVKSKCSYAKSEIEIEFDPEKITPADLNRAVSSLGYQLIDSGSF